MCHFHTIIVWKISGDFHLDLFWSHPDFYLASQCFSKNLSRYKWMCFHTCDFYLHLGEPAQIICLKSERCFPSLFSRRHYQLHLNNAFKEMDISAALWAPRFVYGGCKAFSMMYGMNCFKVFFFLDAIIFISHFTSVIKTGLVGI